MADPRRPEAGYPTIEPNYRVEEGEARAQCADLIAERGESLIGQKYGCYVIGSDDPHSNLGRFVESKVFYETFQNTPETMEEEYLPYDERSDFYVVVDHEESLPIGVLRVIKNTENGLKSLEDLARVGVGFDKEAVCKAYELDPERCADVGTLAVLEQYRGSNSDAGYTPSLLTYRTLYKEILSNDDFDYTIAMIDKRAERGLNKLKFPFKPVFDGGYFKYLDSEETITLIAKNTMFHPQLTYWVNRLNVEAEAESDNEKKTIAFVIDNLINEGFLDSMIAHRA